MMQGGVAENGRMEKESKGHRGRKERDGGRKESGKGRDNEEDVGKKKRWR